MRRLSERAEEEEGLGRVEGRLGRVCGGGAGIGGTWVVFIFSNVVEAHFQILMMPRINFSFIAR